ncbi:hydrophobin [Lyophyllum atratum]|nr:hydrophobin [Lyophyllum atratum]
MFARTSTFVVFFFLALCASANVISRTNGGPNQCNTGTIQCCNGVRKASDPGVLALLGLLGGLGGITGGLGGITGLVGLNCTPIPIIGAGGNSCNAQPVCCTGNNFSGLVVIGCSPINLNL